MEVDSTDPNPFVCLLFVQNRAGGKIRITGIAKKVLNQADQDIHFFPDHEQPLSRHPEFVRNAVNRYEVQYRNKIKIDLEPVIESYWNFSESRFEFSGVPLNSESQNRAKVERVRLNRELGRMKAKVTRKKNKEATERAKAAKRAEQEKAFQERRTKEVKALYASLSKENSTNPLMPHNQSDSLL